jgi:hypothetical protein
MTGEGRLCYDKRASCWGSPMSNLIELAAERLMKLEPDIRAALGAEPNEADTRLKVLDRFLFEVLDWQRDSSVLTEPPTEFGYIDYLLRVGENTNVMVVEAKRQGKLQPATKSSEVMHVNLSGPVVKPSYPASSRRCPTRWSRVSL